MKLTRMITNTNLKKEILKSINHMKNYKLYVEIYEDDVELLNLDVVIKCEDNAVYSDEFTSFSIIEDELEINEENRELLTKECKKIITYLDKHFWWCLDKEIRYTTV